MGQNRKYVAHGEKRQKRRDYVLDACAAACSTVYLQGGAAELHYITTASTGCGTGANINFDLQIPKGHSGPQWIVYDSNNACDNAAIDILVNGVAVADSNQCIGANDERLIIVNVVDVSCACNPLVAVIAPDNLD